MHICSIYKRAIFVIIISQNSIAIINLTISTNNSIKGNAVIMIMKKTSCKLIEDYINYLKVIKGRKPHTVEEYKMDLTYGEI